MDDDPIMRRAFEGQQRLAQGDRAGARRIYEELWARVGDDGDPKHRIWVAHVAADAQDHPADEVRWDELALAAADALAERGDPSGVGVRTFYPSLHLNLGEGYGKLGDAARAREHLEAAERHAAGQPVDDETTGILRAIAALRNRLDHPERYPPVG
ncbi:hypothetical protein [Patulibacter sp. SYSU D01012]|uniref:hypothetical protein n=1 Tax=Patulibacter sp. SYSU D01012 TaxID=2817381 RepID=UPI001B3088E5|nr:hypothetical protein [Patulibacter sp. SYSU D01012]